MNYSDLTRPNSPQMVVYVGNSPRTTLSFRLVKYDKNHPEIVGTLDIRPYPETHRVFKLLWFLGAPPQYLVGTLDLLAPLAVQRQDHQDGVALPAAAAAGGHLRGLHRGALLAPRRFKYPRLFGAKMAGE